MLAAIAAPTVGDDHYGAVETANELQARTAAPLGKESALSLPRGTLSDQVALRMRARSGYYVIVSREAHVACAQSAR